MNTNYYKTTFGLMPGSFNSSQINACVVGIGVLGPRFIVSCKRKGLYKLLSPRGFEPGTSRMPGKRGTTTPLIPQNFEMKHATQVVDMMCIGNLVTNPNL